MKIVARKDMMCLILASLKGNEKLHRQHLMEISKDMGLREVVTRCLKLEKKGYLEGNDVSDYTLTKKGKKVVDKANY